MSFSKHILRKYKNFSIQIHNKIKCKFCSLVCSEYIVIIYADVRKKKETFLIVNQNEIPFHDIAHLVEMEGSH